MLRMLLLGKNKIIKLKIMFENIAKALKNKDYDTANHLIQKLRQEDPENPWLDFYTARLFELNDQLDKAKNNYIELLKHTINPKLISQIRQGIERINQREKQTKEQELNQAKTKVGAEEIGVFVLESLPKDDKKIAAQNFAKIMEIDPYSARLQIPSRSWRLYRIGKMGELSYYVKCLNQVNVPCFCLAIEQIKKLSVYQVRYIETINNQVNSQITVICENQENQLEKIRVNWIEITKRVTGLIPIFENSFKFDKNWQIYHQKEILDYAQFCDLYLPDRQMILRICDQNYDFKKSINLINLVNSDKSHHLEEKEATLRKNWQNLLKLIEQELPNIPVYSEFTFFGETALEFSEFLSEIEPHINIFRQYITLWDQAFHLYSCLVFLKD